MTRIAFLQISTHQNNLYVFAKIATFGNDDVTIFTTELIADSVRTELGAGASDITWIEKSDDESLRSYLQQVEEYCEQIDVLLVQPLFGGLQKLFRYAMFDPPCRRALAIFNTRRWLSASYSFSRRLDYNLKIALRRRIVNRYHALIVEYQPVADYVTTTVGVDLPVYTFSPTLFEAEQYNPDGPIRFTIPGHIEQSRRDYDMVLDVFADLFKQFDDEIELQLLGMPRDKYGDRIVDRCEEFNDAGNNVVTYQEWIPIGEFESELRQSHFLLCPLQRTITKGPIEETYGTTKGSGNIWDAIRTATPLILPAHFAVDDMIADATMTYENPDHLYKRIETLLHHAEERTEMYDQALDMSRSFTRDRQYERFFRLVADLL